MFISCTARTLFALLLIFSSANKLYLSDTKELGLSLAFSCYTPAQRIKCMGEPSQVVSECSRRGEPD